MGRHLNRAEIEQLANSIRTLLADPDADINEPMRRRWESALAALEALLGERSSLVDNLGSDLLKSQDSRSTPDDALMPDFTACRVSGWLMCPPLGTYARRQMPCEGSLN